MKDEAYLYKEYVDDIQSLMRMPAFRRVLWRLIQTSGLFSEVYVESERTTEYLLGRRSLGLELWETAKRNKGADHVTLLKEAQDSKPGPLEEED